ncbi:hypothetical protein Tco_0499216 [Tanacetum coccineum]
MSDSDESGVTHTEISSPFELINIDHQEICGLSTSRIPDILPQEDEVFMAEEQPLPAAASPTAQLPDYVPESNPEADLEEDDNEDPEEDPFDYLADGGDDDDDEDESSEDDEDYDEVNIEADDDEEEEEHPAPADSAVVALPDADQAPSAEETEPFETDESAATPPPHPHTVTLGFQSHSTTPPLHLLSTDYREDRLEVTLPPRKRLGIALGLRCEIRESSSAAAAYRPLGGLKADYVLLPPMDRRRSGGSIEKMLG